MSLTNVPSAEEVMGWNPQSLADYMRRLKLSSCDRVVLKFSITGAKFMNMKQRELEVFPRHCVPILANIQREINTGAQRMTFNAKTTKEAHPVQAFSQNEEVWESDEFDSENDNIYEGPDQEEDGEDYICALAELQTAENKHGGQAREAGCMPQAFAHPTKPLRPQRDVKAQDSRRERSSKPPQPHSKGTDHISPRPFKVPTHYSECKRNRMLPELPDPSQWPGPKLEGGVAVAPGSSAIRLLPPRANRPTDVSNRMSKLLPAPLVPTQPAQENKSVLGRKQDLDASWYGGKVSRQQAEATLREVNKDGAFVVRDSINGSTEHPYTLMLLNQGKVYNIRIRNQGNFYLLGNGLRNTESFPGVKEMINHHTHTPLLLIDAAHPSSTEQPQCCLLHPAGL